MRSFLGALLIIVFAAWIVVADVQAVWADDNTTNEANREFNGRKDQDAFDLDWRLQLTESRTENVTLLMGGVVIFAVFALSLVLYFALKGFVGREIGEIKSTYREHINPNNEVNRQASIAAIQAQTMAAWRETFQTFERGTGAIAGIDPVNRQPNT
jgi:hypothetical protein